MKKITAIVLCIALITILSACEGKKAGPIVLPAVSEIESVKITQDNQSYEKTDANWISALVEQIGMGKATSKATIQDVPNVAEYIRLDWILKSGRIDTMFIYLEKGEWYIEQPYQGIYLVDDALIEMIDNTDSEDNM